MLSQPGKAVRRLVYKHPDRFRGVLPLTESTITRTITVHHGAPDIALSTIIPLAKCHAGIWDPSCRRVRHDLPAAQAGQEIQVHPLHSQRQPVRDCRREDLGRSTL